MWTDMAPISTFPLTPRKHLLTPCFVFWLPRILSPSRTMKINYSNCSRAPSRVEAADIDKFRKSSNLPPMSSKSVCWMMSKTFSFCVLKIFHPVELLSVRGASSTSSTLKLPSHMLKSVQEKHRISIQFAWHLTLPVDVEESSTFTITTNPDVFSDECLQNCRHKYIP